MDVYQNLISRQKEIFSEEEQEILRTTPIVIIGCGGLGGTIIEQFVRAGFEELTIVDQDVFDETNLNRQVRSNLDTVGKSKVKITKSAMEQINPNINITDYDLTIDEKNISKILKGNKILVDAVDNVYTRVLISREAKQQGMVFVHSAVEKTMGQLSVFEPNSVSYEELFRLKSVDKALDDDVKNYLLSISAKKPQVLGVTPSIFGSLQVNETIKYILNKKDVVLAPKVLMWDLFNMSSFRLIKF
ncbi:HesA/MoeB/ThiF family protein [Methanosphaera sp.]|uniref:HesA/MoeB/ThiF family protein n=1 Tax=Methanosphaera sp. TaxID=2666342 RepID=UPI002600167D|nr:HesA/MoeB/ThiF family protein [Methanosphaera sp.]